MAVLQQAKYVKNIHKRLATAMHPLQAAHSEGIDDNVWQHCRYTAVILLPMKKHNSNTLDVVDSAFCTHYTGHNSDVWRHCCCITISDLSFSPVSEHSSLSVLHSQVGFSLRRALCPRILKFRPRVVSHN